MTQGTPEVSPPSIDPNVPSVARIYDYWLGGKDHRAADRKVGDAILEAAPEVRDLVRHNRDFLIRAVTDLVGRGVTQFIDVGCGLPTQRNVHEVAQELAPEARVLYVDNDPAVATHGRALLATDENTVFVQEDLAHPAHILGHAADHLSFDKPIALMLVAILHFFPDSTGIHYRVRSLINYLPAGSYVVISHIESREDLEKTADKYYNVPGVDLVFRNRRQIAEFFKGTRMVHALAPVNEIAPDDFMQIMLHEGKNGPPMAGLAGIGRKP
jgi:hypothetical protein